MLQLIARGYRYKEIAARLHLSVKTVEAHVSSVLRKLQLSSRHELTRWAQERRLRLDDAGELDLALVARDRLDAHVDRSPSR